MAREARQWIARLARLGFAVKGLVYLFVGGLGLRFALGIGGRLTDPHGAVGSLVAAPYGRLLAGGVAIGLGLYAAWRFVEAVADANHRGSDAKALAGRAIYALSGVVYGILAIDAAILASASRGAARGADLPQTITGSALAEWAAMLVAAALVAYGAWQLRAAFSRQLSEQLSHGQVRRHAGDWPVRISRIGIAGRAVVLIVMGIVLARRATTSVEAATETSTQDSLRLIAALPTGDWLLGGVAAGLMAYGVYQLVHARFRTISPPVG